MILRNIFITTEIRIESFFAHIPCSGQLSREKTFVFFAVSEPSVKVFSKFFCGHTHIIIGLEQSAKVFSAKFSFCTET